MLTYFVRFQRDYRLYTRDSRLWLYGGRQLRHGGRQLPVPCAAPDLNVLYMGTLSDISRDDVVRKCWWEVVPVSGERLPPRDAEALHYLPDGGGQARSVLIRAYMDTLNLAEVQS